MQPKFIQFVYKIHSISRKNIKIYLKFVFKSYNILKFWSMGSKETKDILQHAKVFYSISVTLQTFWILVSQWIYICAFDNYRFYLDWYDTAAYFDVLMNYVYTIPNCKYIFASYSFSYGKNIVFPWYCATSKSILLFASHKQGILS